MKRRDLLKLGGGAAASGAVASGQSKPNAEAAEQAKARLFDDHQMQTVATLAALIIPRTDTPSAAEAGVHGHLDRLLAEGPASSRVSFLQGLAWLDGYCLRTHQQPFRKMPAAGQIETLTAMSGKADA